MRVLSQYHVIFDDSFHTVQADGPALAEEWENVYTSNREVYGDLLDPKSVEPSSHDLQNVKSHVDLPNVIPNPANDSSIK